MKLVYLFSKVRLVNAEKLLFDEANKCLLYRQRNGELNLLWGVRGLSLFAIMNGTLAAQEVVNPLMGGWNGVSFGLCSGLSLVGLLFLKIMSKRTIHQLSLFKQGDFVEIKYFNAFWKPMTQTLHVSEFTNLQPSYFGFHKVDLTSVGKVWINLEQNEFEDQFLDQNVLLTILAGIPIRIKK